MIETYLNDKKGAQVKKKKKSYYRPQVNYVVLTMLGPCLTYQIRVADSIYSVEGLGEERGKKGEFANKGGANRRKAKRDHKRKLTLSQPKKTRALAARLNIGLSQLGVPLMEFSILPLAPVLYLPCAHSALQPAAPFRGS
uniref:Uncharacterized protein n=1 Tax=Utricularia reniformis TaxID=192314 RepID=A0A1Y0B1S9_9LAMI|nr:hypothetical protein AEK19_MT1131 [Utricularia reniformis]ART31347.1 hypothetical protein AEK19_MT1131 [Utricularia reniformis]